MGGEEKTHTHFSYCRPTPSPEKKLQASLWFPTGRGNSEVCSPDTDDWECAAWCPAHEGSSIGDCHSLFSCCRDKLLQLKEESGSVFIIALSSGLQSILGEPEVKQLVPLGPQSEGTSMHATCCSASTVHNPGSPSGNGIAHSGWVFRDQLIIRTTPYTHTQKLQSSLQLTTCSNDLWEKIAVLKPIG